MQKFNENDPTEEKMIAIFAQALLDGITDRNTFYAECYESWGLGQALYDLGRDPMIGVIRREVYRTSYPAIHELFTRPGTFEFYLSVFRKIFADDTDVQFTIPAPGQLHIVINALTLETFSILTREIVDGHYVYSPLVTSDLNEPIVGQGVTGIKTQNEMEGLISEISAYGIYTTVELITPEGP